MASGLKQSEIQNVYGRDRGYCNDLQYARVVCTARVST
jgi:hypothetical protein